jgi:uncharacterized protein involved in exopolysaccharide biosynthesis
MTANAALIHHPLVHQIGWAVLHSLWEGALIGVAFGLGLVGLRRRSANARYLAGCLSLALMLAAPIATVLLEPWREPVPDDARGIISGHAGTGAPDLGILSLGAAQTTAGAKLLSQPSTGFLGRVVPVLAVGWVLGVCISALRLTQGCWRVRSLRTAGSELVDVAWLETLNDLRCCLGVSRPVRLLKSALVEVPTVIGWFRPVILLPTATLSGLTPEQLEAILAHELAHLRRLDYVVNAFQCLVEALMFYHPVAWWISRCIREERENCCDDLVVQVCGNRVAYARALAALEAFRGGLPEWAFAATGGSLLNRIRRMLGQSDEHVPALVRKVSGLALAGVGVVLIILGARLLLVPTAFQSTVRLRMERVSSGPSSLGYPPYRTSYDPYFMQTEFELLKSQAVLGPVIDQLGLRDEWGKRLAGGNRLTTSEAIALLRGKMELRPVENTSLMEIRVYSEKPDEAAAIANAIAETYRTHRSEQRAQLARGGIKALEDRLQEQEGKVKEAQRRVDALRAELNISNAAASADGPSPLITAETLRRLESTRIESKSALVQQETLLSRFEELKKDHGEEDLAQAITTAAPDSILTLLMEQLVLADQKLVVLEKDYGPEHAEVIKCKASVKDLHAKIRDRVRGIMRGCEVKVAALKKSLDNFEEEVARATTNDIQDAARSRTYYEAKRNLAEVERFRQVLTLKLASDRIEVQPPDTALVDIIELAEATTRPVAPNLPRALTFIVLGVLLDISGLCLLTGWPRGLFLAQAG